MKMMEGPFRKKFNNSFLLVLRKIILGKSYNWMSCTQLTLVFFYKKKKKNMIHINHSFEYLILDYITVYMEFGYLGKVSNVCNIAVSLIVDQVVTGLLILKMFPFVPVRCYIGFV